MAWNPSPEVQVARDAAAAMTKARHKKGTLSDPIDRCMVIFTTEQGECGYASYGQTKQMCGQARRLADEAFGAIMRSYRDIIDHSIRWEPGGLADARFDFDKIAKQVCDKLMLLKAVSERVGLEPGDPKDTGPQVNHLINRDLVMPCVELLMRFCQAVQVDDEQPATPVAT